MRFFRRRRLEQITEEEAYRRSYGYRTEGIHVTKVKQPPEPTRPRPHYDDVLLRGERIRRAFAARLASRRGRD